MSTDGRRDSTLRIASLDDVDGIVSVQITSREVVYRGRMPDDLMDHLSVEDRRRGWHDRLTQVDPESVTWVAEIGGQVVGFSYACAEAGDRSEPVWHVHFLFIAPGFQGMGLGRALLDRTTSTIAAAGIQRVTLDVFGFNEEALSFYEHLGWVRNGTADGWPFLVYLYEKRLVPAGAETSMKNRRSASGS